MKTAELPWPATAGRVMRHPTLHLEADLRGEMTCYGGLVLAQQCVRRLRVAPQLDAALHLFKRHAPYHESDHILALTYTLYADGTCLEDQAALQGSEAVRRLVGACRIPDPTTAGDFLRRFGAEDVAALARVIDAVQADVWRQLARRTGRRRKRELALVDLDGHIKPLYGAHKEGAEFTHDGRWAYQPLVISLAGTGECLRVINRPGNVRSSHGAAEALTEVLPQITAHFRNAIVRADTDFDRRDVYQAAVAAGAYFAIGAKVYTNRAALVRRVPDAAWQPFVPRTQRTEARGTQRQGCTPDWRVARSDARGYRTLRTTGQWITELPYQVEGLGTPCRLIVRRIRIEEEHGQAPLFVHYRYRLILTNLPRTHTAGQIVDLTYQRCDQENVIEQLGSGIAGWRMPVAEFEGNAAWLQIARLAWNLGKWIAQLALPTEVVRWEWKRFRRHFVYLAAKVLRLGRRVVVRLDGSHRLLRELLAAHGRLQL